MLYPDATPHQSHIECSVCVNMTKMNSLLLCTTLVKRPLQTMSGPDSPDVAWSSCVKTALVFVYGALCVTPLMLS